MTLSNFHFHTLATPVQKVTLMYFIMENGRNMPAVTRHLTTLLRRECTMDLSISHTEDGGCGC